MTQQTIGTGFVVLTAAEISEALGIPIESVRAIWRRRTARNLTTGDVVHANDDAKSGEK